MAVSVDQVAFWVELVVVWVEQVLFSAGLVTVWVVTPAWCIHASFAVPLQIEPLHHRIHAGATPCNTGDLPADPHCNQIHPHYVLDIV